MIEHALVIPVRYQITWKLTKSNDYDAMAHRRRPRRAEYSRRRCRCPCRRLRRR